jgi:hypothetical protein
MSTERTATGKPLFYKTPSVKIGKHWWRLVVHEHASYGRVTAYEWQGEVDGPWNDYHDWPTYNFDDGTYAGCPKSLRKLWLTHKPAILAALGKQAA